MKNYIFILLLLLNLNTFGQTYDTVISTNYKVLMLPGATISFTGGGKYSGEINAGPGGLTLGVANDSTHTASGLTVSSDGTFDFTGGDYIDGEFQNVIHCGKDYGIEILSSKEVHLEGPTFYLGNPWSAFQVTPTGQYIKVNAKLPISCAGQISGTWYNANGTIKICP